MSDKSAIPYRITIELATNPNGPGMAIILVGTTPDLRMGDEKPSNYDCTAMAAAILDFQAQQAKDAARDPQTFKQNQMLMQMPPTGRAN